MEVFTGPFYQLSGGELYEITCTVVSLACVFCWVVS